MTVIGQPLGHDPSPWRSDRQPHDTRQAAVLTWVSNTFGPASALPQERAARFVEEAIELAQAVGAPEDLMSKIVARVYSREAGAPSKELGQAGITLEALAESLFLSADATAEFARVQSIPKKGLLDSLAAKVALGIASDTAAKE